MQESQSSIAAWTQEAFGEPSNDRRIVARMVKELAELIIEGEGHHRPGEIADECADIAIILARIATRQGITLTWALPPTQLGFNGLITSLLADASAIYHGVAIGRPPRAATLNMMKSLASLCATHGGKPLGNAVDAKMAVNRTRKWERDETGFHRHTEHAA